MLKYFNFTTKDVRSATLRVSLLYNLKLCFKKSLRRDAREAEGARLEIVYSANNGIEGSTPSLSAIPLVMSSECCISGKSQWKRCTEPRTDNS
jgi:hypothetical protein